MRRLLLQFQNSNPMGVIPGRATRIGASRRPGAGSRREPGIHKPRLWLWIPGPALTRVPE